MARNPDVWHWYELTPVSARHYRDVIYIFPEGTRPVRVQATSIEQAPVVADVRIRAAHNNEPGRKFWNSDVRMRYANIRDLGTLADFHHSSVERSIDAPRHRVHG